MQLFDLIRNKKVLAEGGNVSSASPGWQGAADQEAEEIDLKIHNRDHMVAQLKELLAAQNESFKAAYGKYIWDPKLLNSGKMFSGSSLQFFDVKGVNTQDFLNKLKKTKVGDIDTQINQDMGDEVTAWLKSIIGQKVGNGTFLGFNSSLSSIWLLDDPQVRIQVDYELGPYDAKTNAPTEWFAYSHSSHYDDMAAGIKGVFHKYINRALTHAQSSEKYVARVLKKSVKISDAPVTDSDYSFAVSSSQGGGMSIKYKPYIDPATGQPMEKDGIPVMQLLEPKDRDYIQNLDQQFQMTYGRKRGAADKNLQGSFVGTLQLMNKSFSPEQNESVARAFLDILFGPGAQMITKDDPERDRDVKFAAVDAMLLGGSGVKPLNLPNGPGIRQDAVKMAMDYADKFNAKRGAAPTTEVAEDAAAEIAAKPNYARQGIKHLYNRLPDGRVSSAEMKDADFLEIAKEIANNGGTLDGLPISLKVDGAGIRFGKDSSGRPFFMTSKVTTPLYQDDVGYFTSFGQERGQDAEQLSRTKKYDDALALITGSKFIQTLPSDTIVQAEMMYNPMAEKTDQGLKFVNIPYDPAKLGGEMTLVPFVFKQYSTGEDRPDADKIKKRLLAASDSKIKIVTNQLEQKGINVSKIINPILNLDPKDKANKPAFDKAKQELSSAIIDSPKLAGKDALGDNMEGIVVNMPNGQMFKVTSSQMKSAMAAKMAQPAAKRQGPLKTAVVAIGSFAGHLGHEDLFNATLNKAKELGGDPYLFIGNAVGEEDPIPTDMKVQTWHKLYPQYEGNISAVMQGGSIMQKVKHELINPRPGNPPKYDNIVIMVGEDRANMPIAGALMKAVNKFPGYEHVKASLETIPRTRPVSFTKLRDVLKNPNATPEQQYAVWASGFDEQKLGKDWILQLMDISRKGMGIVPKPVAQPVPVAERLSNALIRPRKTISELSSEKLGQYKKAAGAQASAADKAGDTKKADKRFSGIVKATKKQFANDEKGVNEFSMSGGDDEEDPFDNYPCYDCGSTIFLHHTELCELAEDNAIRDLPSKPGSQHWTGEIPKGLHPIPGLEEGVAEAFGPLPRERQQIRLGRHTVDIERVGLDNDYISFAWNDSQGQDHYQEVPVGDLGSYDDLIDRIKDEIRYQERQYTDQGVAEGWSQKYKSSINCNNPKGFSQKAHCAGKNEGVAVEPDPKGYQKDLLTTPKNSLVIDTPGDLDWYKLGQHYPTLGTDDPHEYGQGDSDMMIVPYSKQELVDLKHKLDRLKMRYKDIGGGHAQPEIHDKVEEKMLPNGAFAGSDKHKLGSAAHAKGKQKGPVKKGQFVGGMEEAKKKGVDGKACWKGYRYAGTKNGKDKCVPVSEDVENIMGSLIENLLRK
jgi:hypothetical protein